MSFVSGTRAFKGEAAYSAGRGTPALPRRREPPQQKPFIYLSAGVTNQIFIETLALAGESGTKFNGVLCGRATWADGVKIYAKDGNDAFLKWMESTGVENIQNVNKALEAASPWYLKFGVNSMAELG